MKIKIICVGKVKEKYFRDAIEEYSKRLSRYCSLEIIEVADEMTPDGASEATNNIILQKEGERIKSKIKDTDYVVTLEILGTKYTSENFARKLASVTLNGNSSIAFVIGGSLGLSEDIKAMSQMKLSFSDMTFPHQLMRVVLLEQIYRAFKINSNEPYHK